MLINQIKQQECQQINTDNKNANKFNSVQTKYKFKYYYGRMYISNNINQFGSITSKQRQKVQTIFNNLNDSRKSLSRLYKKSLDGPQQKRNYFYQLKSNHNNIGIKDSIFATLYNQNLNQINKQHKSTLSNKTKNKNQLEFKINYVQNHRPNIKERILQKVKEAGENNYEYQQQVQFVHNRPNKINKLKNFIINSNHTYITQDHNHSDRSRFQTLPVRKIKSSLDNYNQTKCNSRNFKIKTQYKEVKNKKNEQGDQSRFPQHIKNIMKPCKIQGIQLSNRPLSSLKISPSKKLSSQKLSLQKQFITNKIKLSQQRYIKTARESNQRSSLKNLKDNLQKLVNKQKQIENFQPWEQVNNAEEQEHKFLY